MIIGIASGKGGTGKTTVALSLARIASGSVCYVDCDVEEPNGHIFLAPEILETSRTTVPVPRVDERVCNFCGKCREACRFNAIAVLPKSVIIFDELCHGCGGCVLACPLQAIHEEYREIGVVERGKSGTIDYVGGRLDVGEAIVPPLIRAVKREMPETEHIFVDAPPGTSCPVIAAVSDVDYCLLVTEPTPFGLHDLKLAVEMVREMGLPFGVVINRDGIGEHRLEDYCKSEKIRVLIRIPDDRRIAEAYSRGEIVIDALPELRGRYQDLLREIHNESTGHLA